MQEISKQPLICAKVREIVREIAVVSTTPTEVGTQVLTPFHKHGSVKRIRDKPAGAILQDFPEQFLHMVAAEKEGLVKVSCLLAGTTSRSPAASHVQAHSLGVCGDLDLQ